MFNIRKSCFGPHMVIFTSLSTTCSRFVLIYPQQLTSTLRNMHCHYPHTIYCCQNPTRKPTFPSTNNFVVSLDSNNATCANEVSRNHWECGLCPSFRIIYIYTDRKKKIRVQWLRLQLSKGPNRVHVYQPSPEDGNRSISETLDFLVLHNTECCTESKIPLILLYPIVRTLQNPQDSLVLQYHVRPASRVSSSNLKMCWCLRRCVLPSKP
jgi:hypothetical protein